MFNRCPSPRCTAGHGDVGTPARPLRGHLSLLCPPNLAVGKELGTGGEGLRDTR